MPLSSATAQHQRNMSSDSSFSLIHATGQHLCASGLSIVACPWTAHGLPTLAPNLLYITCTAGVPFFFVVFNRRSLPKHPSVSLLCCLCRHGC